MLRTHRYRLGAAVALVGIAILIPASVPAAAAQPPTIMFLGDSLTAGYGLGAELAFPALIEARIRAAGLDYRVVNAGLSGETSAGGLRRIDWLMRQPVSIIVLELGANDGLRGTDLESTRANLQAIIDKARAANPGLEIILAGMQVPPNLGPEYTEQFRALFPQLAAANDAHLIPFLLQGVGGVPELNLADGIHPNTRGHEIVADNVWSVLGPLLRRPH